MVLRRSRAVDVEAGCTEKRDAREELLFWS